MNEHPSTGDQPDDDEALIARVAARQEAHLGRPVPTDLDPRLVRLELGDARRSMAVALWALRRDGHTTPDAIDAALADLPPGAHFDLPPGVAQAIFERVPDHHRGDVLDALDTELDRFATGPGTRELAELSVHRIADATRTGIATSIAAESAGQVDHHGHPFSEGDIAQAAEFAAGIVIAAVIDRLRDDLAALAGMP